MKFRDHSNIKRAEMQMAPMIDVVFILLLFFIVTWNFARFEAEIDISVPSAETAEESQPTPGEIVVNVNKDGVIKVNSQELTQDQLFVRLSRVSNIYKDQPIILRGDEGTEFRHIMKVLDTCQKAGIWNVSFAAKKEVPGAPPGN